MCWNKLTGFESTYSMIFGSRLRMELKIHSGAMKTKYIFDLKCIRNPAVAGTNRAARHGGGLFTFPETAEGETGINEKFFAMVIE